METPNKTKFHAMEMMSPSLNSSMEHALWRQSIDNSPSVVDDSSKMLNRSLDSATGFNKSSRGRPKSEILTTLMIQVKMRFN